MGTGNYSATSNNMKSVHWPLMGGLYGLLYLVQRGGDWTGPQPAQAPPRCIPNVIAYQYPSTASEPISVFLYNGPLLCGFNVGIKGLINNAARKKLEACFEHAPAVCNYTLYLVQ